jgi:acetate---CoA ligase (ADP-forming)
MMKVMPMPSEVNLRSLLDARSVAVIGAIPAREHGKLASKPIANLQKYGFSGRIYPVNPKFEEISGLTCYPDLSSIPETVDCVMVLRRADQVAGTANEMGKLGIRGAVVCSAGFAEIGGDGVLAQNVLVNAVTDNDVTMCGPNTNGVLNFRTGMMLGFHPLLEQEERVRTGSVSIISHSGTVTGAIMRRLQDSGLGFGYVISSGNEATLQAADYMEYLASDPETSTVVLYLEQIRDGERFAAACRRLRDAGKKVLALKAGASDDAARVAFGHTGALVGSHAAFTAAAGANGVTVCQGLEELVALTKAASITREPSKTIVGLSMSGGLNGLMADAVNRAGGSFAPLDELTIDRLRELIPISTPTNPFDLTGLAVDTPGVLRSVLEILKEGTQTSEFVFSLGLMPDATWPEWADVCSDFASASDIRMSVYAASGRREEDGYGYFERAGICVYDAIEPLIRALVGLAEANDSSASAEVSVAGDPGPVGPIPHDVPGRRELLQEWGLNYIPYAFVGSEDEAVASSSSMGYPVALKVASEAVAHKAKYGLIALDVHSAEHASKEFARLSGNFEALRGVLPDLGALRVEVQKMLPRGGMEVFLGGKVDPTFGPVVSVGLGGGLVEAIADLSSAPAPLDENGARRLIHANAVLHRALTGGRWDEAALTSTVARFSQMLSALAPQLDEAECNPVVVFEDGATIVDDLWMTHSNEREDR